MHTDKRSQGGWGSPYIPTVRPAICTQDPVASWPTVLLHRHHSPHLVGEAVKAQFEAGKKIAAICAAPAVVLAQIGVLNGKKATCYPGFEKALNATGATYTGDLVTVDGNVTTAEGPAAAFPYAYELLTQLVDKQTSDQIAEGMRFKHLMAH